MTEQKQPKNWRRMLADLGGYENGLINIPAAGVIPIIDEVEKLRAKLEELARQEPSYLLYPNGRCGLPGRPPLDAGHADATVLKLYLAAGARPPEPAPAGEYPAGAIVNGRAHIERLEATYQFECEAGPLSNCKDWQGLKRCFEYLIGRIDADRAMRAAQPAPGAGDQVQMILKHRLMRKVAGDWLAASEFMTGEPDPSWLAKTEESPEEWRIEQSRRVSGEQIQAGLTRAFASWKKPAPAAVVGPNDGSTPGIWFVRTQERFGELRDCFVSAPDCQGLPYGAEILGDDEYRDGVARKLADCKLIVAAVNAYRATPQPAPAAQADAKDAARYRWLTDDHKRQATRIVRNAICERLPVMSLSAASANIDAAMAADIFGDAPQPSQEPLPLKPMCCRCLDESDDLLPANCSEKPELLTGAPLGMYHCPDCGAMVCAGFPHGPLCQTCHDRKHPDFDCDHTNTVKAACRAGIEAALAVAPTTQPAPAAQKGGA